MFHQVFKVSDLDIVQKGSTTCYPVRRLIFFFLASAVVLVFAGFQCLWFLATGACFLQNLSWHGSVVLGWPPEKGLFLRIVWKPQLVLNTAEILGRQTGSISLLYFHRLPFNFWSQIMELVLIYKIRGPGCLKYCQFLYSPVQMLHSLSLF